MVSDSWSELLLNVFWLTDFWMVWPDILGRPVQVNNAHANQWVTSFSLEGAFRSATPTVPEQQKQPEFVFLTLLYNLYLFYYEKDKTNCDKK